MYLYIHTYIHIHTHTHTHTYTEDDLPPHEIRYHIAELQQASGDVDGALASWLLVIEEEQELLGVNSLTLAVPYAGTYVRLGLEM